MTFHTILALFIILIISIIATHDLFHPSCVVSGLWLTLVSLYHFTDHPLWDLSEKFYIALLCWTVPFCILSLLTSKRPIKLNRPTYNYKFHHVKYKRYYKFFFGYIAIFIVFLFMFSGGSFGKIRQLLISPDLPIAIKLLLYISNLALIFVFYSIYYLEQIPKSQFAIVIIGILIVTIFKSNKTSVLLLFVSVLYLISRKKQINLKFILISIAILVLFLIIISINRADYDFHGNNAILNYIYIYILSPLTAFDGLINNEIFLDPGTKGSGTFAFFYKILNALGANIKISQLGDWVDVPLRTNVFTTMRGFYLDGGLLWISVMGGIIGATYGIFYALQKKGHVVYILFYAAAYSGLFFQSFGDYFMYGLSTIIQYYIFSLLIVKGVKFKACQISISQEGASTSKRQSGSIDSRYTHT